MQSGANFGAPLGLLFVRAVASYTGLIETVAQSLREHRGGIFIERPFNN